MSQFLRLLCEADKAQALATACARLRKGEADRRHFEVAPEAFDAVPGKPFAYWVSDAVRQTFTRMPRFESEGRVVRVGLQTSDDFRFVRGWWEVDVGEMPAKWFPFAKGGAYSPIYGDLHLVVNWELDGLEMKSWADPLYDNSGWSRIIKSTEYYFRPGITWPLRAHRFAPQAMPAGCIFSVRGYSAFPEATREAETLSLFSGLAFDYLFKTALGRFGYPEFIVGILQLMPWPTRTDGQAKALSDLGRRAWSLKRTLDSSTETSHAFLVPAALRARMGDYDPPTIEAELGRIQAEIDAIAFDLYGFSEVDRQAAMGQTDTEEADDVESDEDDEEGSEPEAPAEDALLSWAVGVAFGRFDWRLATKERVAPPEPDPFDPLPVKSPGMVPDGAAPFHACAGILVDDPGHPHDLARLAEEVLTRVDAAVPDDVRRWLRRDFFAFHLQRYSKSRRKAPIYWPLSTSSGSYTLWVYYPSLSSQALYTAINDFIDPKLRQVASDVADLRNKGTARSREDESQFEALQGFELELIELGDTLLKLAPTYKPNHDDGVQITAAPLRSLFHHKPWQKVLKDTWVKLEKGDYDWTYLAMNYWPERVREKCKTDKSLAIAHGLEKLYVEPQARSDTGRARTKK